MDLSLENIVQLCNALPEFGQLHIEADRVLWERSFRVASAADLRSALSGWQEGESLQVRRFPDAYKVTFTRTLSPGG